MERSRSIFIFILPFFIFIFMDSICNEVVSLGFLKQLFLLVSHFLITIQGVESSPSCRTINSKGRLLRRIWLRVVDHQAPMPTFNGFQLEGYLETSAAASN
jgi:hypothetical protein